MYDDRCEPIPFHAPTDLVGITVETYTARRSYEIAEEYRRRGVPVVMGGFQPTFVPEECAQHADALVIGDAETIWAQVIADARNGDLKPRYSAPPGPIRVKKITAWFVDAFVGMGAKIVSLRLQEIRRQPSATVAVKVAQRGTYGRHWNSHGNGCGDQDCQCKRMDTSKQLSEAPG